MTRISASLRLPKKKDVWCELRYWQRRERESEETSVAGRARWVAWAGLVGDKSGGSRDSCSSEREERCILCIDMRRQRELGCCISLLGGGSGTRMSLADDPNEEAAEPSLKISSSTSSRAAHYSNCCGFRARRKLNCYLGLILSNREFR